MPIRANQEKRFQSHAIDIDSKSIRINPKTPKRINLKKMFNMNQFQLANPNHSDVRLNQIENYTRIHSDWKSRIKSD